MTEKKSIHSKCTSISDVARFYLRSPAPVPTIDKLKGEFKVPPIISSLDRELGDLEQQRKLQLPDLTSFDSLAVYSDYSDKKRFDSNYLVYSLLFSSTNIIQPFSDKLFKIQQAFNVLPKKEIAYKDLSYGPLQRALPDIIHAINQIPGPDSTLFSG